MRNDSLRPEALGAEVPMASAVRPTFERAEVQPTTMQMQSQTARVGAQAKSQ